MLVVRGNDKDLTLSFARLRMDMRVEQEHRRYVEAIAVAGGEI